MKKKYWWLILLASLTLSVGLAACNKSKDADESHLQQALAMLPADTKRVYFTDWALIKEYEDATEINSKSSLELKVLFLRFGMNINQDPPIPMRQATASGFGLSRIPKHAESWSWDSLDLVWEVTVELEGPPTYVLQFPKEFDFAPFVAILEQRGFDQSSYKEVTIYSHPMDLKADWITTSEFGILNTAILAEEKRLVLSASIEPVQKILDVHQQGSGALGDNQAVQSTVKQLGQVASAFIDAGVDVCLSFSAAPMLEMIGKEISEEQLARLKELLEQDQQIHPYTALGVGYRYENDQLLGLIVMHYPNADDAQADLEARRQLAQEGISLRMRRPYREAVFTLDDASVNEENLVLQVSPVGGMPRRLFDMVFVRDMLFAACP